MPCKSTAKRDRAKTYIIILAVFVGHYVIRYVVNVAVTQESIR